MSANHALRVYDSILELLSNEENPTPLVRLQHVVPFEHARVYGKLEWYNPFGAVKDRIAANLVRDAEERRILGPGRKLVEPTSGNTGLGLSMIGNVTRKATRCVRHCPRRSPSRSGRRCDSSAAT
jgi:cysteine synthase